METLGHSQMSLTVDTYSHVIPALQREAADRMESVLAATRRILTFASGVAVWRELGRTGSDDHVAAAIHGDA